ncbi:MAG TPA: FadR/GntR family transcriptional regulator [Acidimicrobiales bacterium]|nr:FadR/GntR family transcriptional regulator [Acidimicrobiales bacterium]
MAGTNTTERPEHGLAERKLARRTLASQLLDELRANILSGRLEPGHPLPVERQLCEAFGVGRTTVREALQGLLAAGLVRREGNRLVVVARHEVSPEEVDYSALASRLSVRDVYETRKLIEVEIVRLAAERHTAAQLAELRALLEDMDPTDPEGYHVANERFHQAIARMCPNRVLVDVYLSNHHVFFKLPAYWRLFGSEPLALGGGRRGHEELYEAIASGDGERAAREMWVHLDRVEQRLIERIRTAAGVADGGADA